MKEAELLKLKKGKQTGASKKESTKVEEVKKEGEEKSEEPIKKEAPKEESKSAEKQIKFLELTPNEEREAKQQIYMKVYEQ